MSPGRLEPAFDPVRVTFLGIRFCTSVNPLPGDGGGSEPAERTNFAQLKTVFAYDPKTDTWSRQADMPTARRWLAVAAVDGIIYALGGGGWYEKEMNTVEAYDPKANAWVGNTVRFYRLRKE